MYADNETPSMKKAIYETRRRRQTQAAYKKENGIEPKTIIKSVRDLIEISRSVSESEATWRDGVKMTAKEREVEIRKLEKEMQHASKMLEFEYAAILRDRIIKLRGNQ